MMEEVDNYLEDSSGISTIDEIGEIEKSKEEDLEKLEQLIEARSSRFGKNQRILYENLKNNLKASEFSLSRAISKFKGFLTKYPQVDYSIQVIQTLEILRAYAQQENNLRSMIEFFMGIDETEEIKENRRDNKYKKITPQMKDVYERYMGGERQKEIAKSMGKSNITICNWIKKIKDSIEEEKLKEN